MANNDNGSSSDEWSPLDWSEFLEASAYEGIVTPGGKIMMGRWIDVLPEGRGESGPFIFWDL